MKLRMILVFDVLLGISQTFAQTTTTLPVYQVAQTGLNDSQTKALYASLKIPAAKAVHKNGMVSFVDPIDYLAIPSKPVTDAGVLKQLLASTKNEGPGSPIRVDAIDFDALRKWTVLDSGSALKFAAAGFASAGVQLGSAKPTVSHTVFAASSYVPLVRTTPPGSTFAPSETRPASESVSVTVTDANGIATQASQVVAVLAQPIAPDTSGVSHGGASYGCESPGEPEEWTQERVGWQQGMANPGGGSQQFCWLGDTSWPGDYIKPTPAGSLPATPWIYGDADYSNWGVNTANLVLINYTT